MNRESLSTNQQIRHRLLNTAGHRRKKKGGRTHEFGVVYPDCFLQFWGPFLDLSQIASLDPSLVDFDVFDPYTRYTGGGITVFCPPKKNIPSII
jgi:hypothetical protein